MKIAYVLDDTLDSSDGVQQYIIELSGEMKRLGHEVHYIVGQTKRSDISNIHSFARNKRVRFNKNVVSIPYPVSPKKVRALLSEQNFDVIHVQMPYSPMLAARVISLAHEKTAIVGTFHIAPYSRIERFASRLLGYMLRPNIRLFDEIISVSSPAAILAQQTFHVSSQVIPNMVNVDFYKKNRQSGKKKHHFVFVGRLVPRKGCIHFIDALAKVKKHIPDFTAAIVGTGPEEKKLKQRVIQLDLKKHITFAGYVSEEEKAKHLAASSIAVFPATGGESFGIVLLEAMAAGSLVLGGNNPGYRSVLESVPETICSASEFSDKIIQFSDDKSAYLNLLRKQQQLLGTFDAPVVAEKVLEVYNRALAKRTPFSHN